MNVRTYQAYWFVTVDYSELFNHLYIGVSRCNINHMRTSLASDSASDALLLSISQIITQAGKMMFFFFGSLKFKLDVSENYFLVTSE